MTTKKTFASFIRSVREGRGMEQKELAKRMGMSATLVSRTETGYRLPSDQGEIAHWLKTLGEAKQFSKACELYVKDKAARS